MLGIVRVQAAFYQCVAFVWVVVSDGGVGGYAQDADGVAREHGFPEVLVATCCVGVALGASGLVVGGPALGALAAPLVEVSAAGFGADSPAHVGLGLVGLGGVADLYGAGGEEGEGDLGAVGGGVYRVVV